MSTYLSENLNESETVTSGSARLTGYSLSGTGVEHRFVTISGGPKKIVVVVPPGETKGISGMSEPFPDGITIESKVGDGMLVANVFYEDSGPVSFPEVIPVGEE